VDNITDLIYFYAVQEISIVNLSLKFIFKLNCNGPEGRLLNIKDFFFLNWQHAKILKITSFSKSRSNEFMKTEVFRVDVLQSFLWFL